MKTRLNIKLEQQYGAHNYEPLPVVLTRGHGVHVWDVEGKQYIDMMSAYSAISHGHCHPELVQTVMDQVQQLNVVSRAFYSDQLGKFLKLACETFRFECALPMNSGAEAVETALKAARKWAYKVKGVKDGEAKIIACTGNFHGRTLGIISMSSEHQYRDGFSPYLPGFQLIPYGDVNALRDAMTPNTAALIIEPIQGEGGIIVPPESYLKACRALCDERNVLFIADEIQTGLGRTGYVLAHHHEGIQADAVVLGKALGGGILPVSLFLADRSIMDVFQPGDHGSTFGGNPLASAVAHQALRIMLRDDYAHRAKTMGDYFLSELKKIKHPSIRDVRGRGLLIGVELDPLVPARKIALSMMEKGILCKDTHHTVLRFAPPLIIEKNEIDECVAVFKMVLNI